MTVRNTPSAPWNSMDSHQRLSTAVRLAVAVLTFGFIFPRAMDPFLCERE